MTVRQCIMHQTVDSGHQCIMCSSIRSWNAPDTRRCRIAFLGQLLLWLLLPATWQTASICRAMLSANNSAQCMHVSSREAPLDSSTTAALPVSAVNSSQQLNVCLYILRVTNNSNVLALSAMIDNQPSSCTCCCPASSLCLQETQPACRKACRPATDVHNNSADVWRL